MTKVTFTAYIFPCRTYFPTLFIDLHDIVMLNIKAPGLWGLIILAPTIFILILSLAFNDLSASVMVVVLIGLGISAYLLFLAWKMNKEATIRDNPSRPAERRRSSRSRERRN